MATDLNRAGDLLMRLLRNRTPEELTRLLEPKLDAPAAKVPRTSELSGEAVAERWRVLRSVEGARDALLDPGTLADLPRFQRNIENLIGTVKVPVGIAGPLRVNGLFAQGDYYVPLATTEAALVASYSRGAQLISDVGGCSALLLNEGVSRAPAFGFRTVRDAGNFLVWVLSQREEFRRRAEATTRHGELTDLSVTVEGNHVYLQFQFRTGDAAGQNIVTLATAAICDYIRERSPVAPESCFVEANFSGDKKASAQSFMSVRGKKVTAEVTLPAALVRERLHTTPARMADYWRMSAVGGSLSGTIGVQGHYANGLAALYIACGQDAACVSESAVGLTRLETTPAGDLYASVTLPNIVVGTVGGGTGLPSQRACLEILGLAGQGKAQALAEVCAGLALAGEISISGAICAHEFARAHQELARGSAPARPSGAEESVG